MSESSLKESPPNYQTMPLGLVIRAVCLYYRSLNLAEVPPASNKGKIVPGLHPNFKGGIDHWTGGRSEPWCGDVAHGIEMEATALKYGKAFELHSKNSRSVYPSVFKTSDWAKANNLWYNSGKILVDSTPLVIGARVIFRFSHTGIVTGIITDIKGKPCKVVVDAGNHNNKFAPKIYPLSQIAGFIVHPKLREEPVYQVDDALNGAEKEGGKETTR